MTAFRFRLTSVLKLREATRDERRAQLAEAYSSAYTYNPEQTLIEKARGLMSANIGWKSDDNHWRINIYGTNLTNKEYNTNETYQGTGGWRDPGVPREYGVTFGAAWK